MTDRSDVSLLIFSLSQGPDIQSGIGVLADFIKLTFSWVILMPIAVIISGKLLSHTFRLSRQSGQEFKIRIPGLLRVGARNEEVTLGFVIFLSSFFFTATLAGESIYQLFVKSFGIDLGQFTSLCVFCSFESVVLSCTLLVVNRLIAHLGKKSDPIAQERDQQVEEVARRVKGKE